METVLTVLINLRDFFNHHIIFTLGILLLTGFFLGKLAQKVKLPVITGYILAGLLLSGSVTGIVREEIAESFTNITEIALGLIALTIGGEFNLYKLKKIGGKIVVIAFLEGICALVFVSIGLTIAGLDTRFALLLGAIAVATAPAATVIIVRELRARGTFVDYLYGIVAFDDAVCVILFSIVFSFVSGMMESSLPTSGIFSTLFHVIFELVLSVSIGFIAGYILHVLTIRKYIANEILLISLSIIFLVTAIAIVLHVSLIITNMVMGTVLINVSFKNRRIFTILEPLTPPVFALFFIIAGTELHISVFSKTIVVFWGVLYIITRFLGKVTGVYIASVLVKAPVMVKRYLGYCLFPQAGVAIGLVLFLQSSPVITNSTVYIKGIHVLVVLINIVLINVLINELIGPLITRYGITKGADL